MTHYTCSTCDNVWGGVARAHCSGNHTSIVEFVKVDGKREKALLRKHQLVKANPGALAQHAAFISDLRLDNTARMPRMPRGFRMPVDHQRAPLVGHNLTSVAWGMVSDQFPINDLFLSSATFGVVAIEIPGLDANGEAPALAFLRSAVRKTRAELDGEDPADRFELIVRSGCHRTFVGFGAFDLHRSASEGCVDPSSIHKRDGSRALYLNGELWGSEEDPAPRIGFPGRRSESPADGELVFAR